MREASAEREIALSQACLALHPHFVPNRIAAILQAANKGVVVK